MNHLPLEDLRADCASCAGLCCVVPAFTASSDFALDKPGGVPCPNLGGDDLCSIHDRLPERGFRGCVVYDCFGAGQRVVQSYAGRGWRDAGVRERVVADFEVVERLHELLWYLADARARPLPRALRDEVDGLRDAVEAAAGSPAEEAVEPLQRRTGALLAEVSGAVRAAYDGERLGGHDLVGADLRGRELEGADLRGALLIGADLRGLGLGPADLLGADLRGCDVRGTDLSETLFLTRAQLTAARGDSATGVPPWLERPSLWGSAVSPPAAPRSGRDRRR